MADFLQQRGSDVVRAAGKRRTQPASSAHGPIGLAASAGNRAVSALLAGQDQGGPTPVQREPSEAVENPLEPVIETLMGRGPENPLEPGNEAMEWKNRGEVPHLLHHAHEDAELVEKAAESGSQYTPHSGSFVEANAAFLGPMEMGLGAWGVADGLHKGGSEGYQEALGGAASFTGGAATTLTPMLGAAATAPFALGATAFAGGMAVGQAGVEESPYDLPGTAADFGESAERGVERLTHNRTAGKIAGGVATLAGSAAMVPAAGYYGAKHLVKDSIDNAGVGSMLARQYPAAEPPVIDLPASREELDDN